MTHKSIALPVAARTVRLVHLNNRLYVPLRFLVEETLDMNWGGQRKRLLAMAKRWKLADLLVSGKRRSVQQPCLPVALVTPYLWSLRPTRPETLAVLERLRDQWEPALFAYLCFDTSELANVGGFMIAEVERIMLPLVKEREDLRRQLAEAKRPTVNILSAPVQARDRETTPAETFMEIARLNNEGMSNTDIARRVKVSRVMVSQFLNGKYATGHAKTAWAELASSGWKKTATSASDGECTFT